MVNEKSEKMHNLTLAIMMLVMGYEGDAFQMGAKPTWISPVNFGVFSVGYVLLVIIENFEEDEDVKHYADVLTHIFGFIALFFLVAIVSVEFSIGLASSTSVVALWYALNHIKNTENPIAPANPNPDKIHLLILAILGGAMVFVQIGLSIGMEQTNLSHIYFGVAAIAYTILRLIELLEEDYMVKSIARHLSCFSGLVVLALFVGFISIGFALAIFICSIVIISRYLCRWWWTDDGVAGGEEERLLQ